MKLKDKEFEIFGSKYRLEYVDEIETEKEGSFVTGRTNSATNVIYISRYDADGKPVDPSEHKITLLHELIHAILDEGQYLSSSGDEPLVEWLARCINSLLKQKIIQ